jgi:hypothetical protein
MATQPRSASNPKNHCKPLAKPLHESGERDRPGDQKSEAISGMAVEAIWPQLMPLGWTP